MSGYTNCACRDCFDIAVSSDQCRPGLCGDCEDAGCDPHGAGDCARVDLEETQELDFEPMARVVNGRLR